MARKCNSTPQASFRWALLCRGLDADRGGEVLLSITCHSRYAVSDALLFVNGRIDECKRPGAHFTDQLKVLAVMDAVDCDNDCCSGVPSVN